MEPFDIRDSRKPAWLKVVDLGAQDPDVQDEVPTHTVELSTGEVLTVPTDRLLFPETLPEVFDLIQIFYAGRDVSPPPPGTLDETEWKDMIGVAAIREILVSRLDEQTPPEALSTAQEAALMARAWRLSMAFSEAVAARGEGPPWREYGQARRQAVVLAMTVALQDEMDS